MFEKNISDLLLFIDLRDFCLYVMNPLLLRLHFQSYPSCFPDFPIFLFPNLIILLQIRRAVANSVTVFNGLLVWRSLTSAITSEAETVARFSHAFESTKMSYKMLDFVSRMKRYTLKPHHLWYYTVDHLVAAQLQI